MKAAIAFSLLAIASSVSPADAADADVLKRFGMLGRFAFNCAAPPSESNQHLIYSISSDGTVTRTLKSGGATIDGSFPMRNLRLLAPDRLQHDETGRQSDLTITVAKIGSKIRSWRSVRADGTVLILDGKMLSTGSPTRIWEKCAN